jgi:kynureninase
MVLIEPIGKASIITTEQIISTIDEHASSTALILLPGIQYYSGQLLDIKKITAHAHSKGLLIGWDLAHAAGNVVLHLHDWDVDFAAWCTYKYLNSGPGAIGGLFVHEKHGKVEPATSGSGKSSYRPRLSGWWGGDKSIRFEMGAGKLIEMCNIIANPIEFRPRPGAAGFQLGNPPALSIAGVLASLEIFNETSMQDIRKKSVEITKYLEDLLLQPGENGQHIPYEIITPSDPDWRGAQLSVKLEPGMLDSVLEGLEDAGVVIDERKPDVIRVAPVPLYNSYTDVWEFSRIFRQLCFSTKNTE